MAFDLRQYQHTALSCAMHDLQHHSSIIQVLPTGAGKTILFTNIADKFITHNPTKAVLVLSHLSLLTEQTKEKFRLVTPHLNVGIQQGEQTPTWSDQVIISTMQTSRIIKHSRNLVDTLAREIGLIIVDESHFLPTDSYQTVLSYYPNAKIIGFTATPFREKKIMTSYFDKVSYSISLGELIKAGYLVPPKITEVISESSEIEKVISQVMTIYKLHEQGKQGIVYMRTIEDAKLLCSAFQEIGVNAKAVTKNITGEARSRMFEQFDNGQIQIMATVNVLTAGFDSPNVETIYMPYGTSSPTTYLQRIGRGLRLKEGKKYCNIYVSGKTPSVSKKMAERLTERVLNIGSVTPKDYATVEEDLEYNHYEEGSEIYVWNQTVMDAVKKMKKIGMVNFSQLLNKKQFPPQFLNNITTLIDNLPDKRAYLKNGESGITNGQYTKLFQSGFPAEVCSNLTKNEANLMISAISNRNKAPTDSYIIPEGIHKGKRVFEVPHAYREKVTKKYPDSPVAKIISKWESHRRKA